MSKPNTTRKILKAFKSRLLGDKIRNKEAINS